MLVSRNLLIIITVVPISNHYNPARSMKIFLGQGDVRTALVWPPILIPRELKVCAPSTGPLPAVHGEPAHWGLRSSFSYSHRKPPNFWCQFCNTCMHIHARPVKIRATRQEMRWSSTGPLALPHVPRIDSNSTRFISRTKTPASGLLARCLVSLLSFSFSSPMSGKRLISLLSAAMSYLAARFR